jgi:hypothetical protein
LRRLFGLWRRRPLQNAAIVGPRRSGKTSLLRYLMYITLAPPERLRPGQRADWLPDPERYRWVYADLQDPRLGSREGFVRHVLSDLGLPIPDPCDLDGFMDVVSRHLPGPAIVLLDEIGVAMERYPELDNAFWEGLRSLANSYEVGGRLAFVLSSDQRPQDLARHGGYGSPFFNTFGYVARLDPLREAEARALIASAPVPFPEADVDWILAHSGRWPLLLQILCRERFSALEAGEVGDDWREEATYQMAPFRYLLKEAR